MPKDLIIVESPAKTRTLAGFLGSSYQIMASMGHVRDLPKSKLGVDVEDGFEPSYTVIPERKQIIAELKKAAKDAAHVYLASDPDREIEAFVPVEYWSITAQLTPMDRDFPFAAKLIEQDGKKIELHNEAETQAVLDGLKGASWKVASIKRREQKRNPAAPFITSTLQQ